MILMNRAPSIPSAAMSEKLNTAPPTPKYSSAFEVKDLRAARVRGVHKRGLRLRSVSGNQGSVDLPLVRYYMQEDLAPRAERVYLEHNLMERNIP